MGGCGQQVQGGCGLARHVMWKAAACKRWAGWWTCARCHAVHAVPTRACVCVCVCVCSRTQCCARALCSASASARTMLTASSGKGTGTTMGLSVDVQHPMVTALHAQVPLCVPNRSVSHYTQQTHSARARGGCRYVQAGVRLLLSFHLQLLQAPNQSTNGPSGTKHTQRLQI